MPLLRRAKGGKLNKRGFIFHISQPLFAPRAHPRLLLPKTLAGHVQAALAEMIVNPANRAHGDRRTRRTPTTIPIVTAIIQAAADKCRVVKIPLTSIPPYGCRQSTPQSNV